MSLIVHVTAYTLTCSQEDKTLIGWQPIVASWLSSMALYTSFQKQTKIKKTLIAKKQNVKQKQKDMTSVMKKGP